MPTRGSAVCAKMTGDPGVGFTLRSLRGPGVLLVVYVLWDLVVILCCKY